MPNEINIDRLSIEIKTSADEAAGSLDRLSKMLTSLSESVSKITGLIKLNNQLAKLSDTLAKFAAPANFTATINALKTASGLDMPNFTKTANSLSKLSKSISEIDKIPDLSSFSEKVSHIAEAVRPLETLGKNTLSPFISSLKAIPKVTASIDTSTLERFRKTIKEIVAAIEPLAERVTKAEKGLVALNGVLQATTRQNGNNAASNAALVKSYTSLASVVTSFKAKLAGVVFVARRVGTILSDALSNSNEYIEALNLFTVAMGDGADEAFRFAQEVNNALGVDVGEFIRNQGTFKQITSAFGVVQEKANLMSKNLTQIGYDISSFFNINIDEAMQKVQSGISGELEPLRRLGYALDKATLQQVAYNNGITQNINTMTQAQKSQLRYIAILQQSANVMGDMARTIATPANSMRILGQQITQFKRAIGNVVSVLVVKLIPYIQVAIRLLTDFANYLAELWGFELPTIDYSGMENGLSTVTDDAEDASEAVQDTVKAVQRLAGFDEINVLKSAKDDAEETADALTNQFDLGIDLPEYDFLQGVENSTEELYQKAKKWLKELYKWWEKHKAIIKIIGGLLAGLWAANKISKYVDSLKNVFGFLKNIASLSGLNKATSFLGTLKSIFTGGLFGVSSGLFSFDLFKNLTQGTLTWKTALVDTLGVIGSIAAAFAIGGPIAGGIAIFGALIGLVAGLNYELGKTFDEAMIELFNNGGVKISEITDKFEKQYSKVDKTAEKIKYYLDTINSNRSKIVDAQDAIMKLSDAINEVNGAMTKEQAEQIKENFKIIADAIKSNIGSATQGILDSFSDTISRTAEKIGIDLGTVIADIQGFEKELTGNVDKAQGIINDYVDKLMDGATPTREETEKYEQAWGYFMEKARKTSGFMDFQQEMNIDFSKIDFMSEADLDEQLQRLTDAAKRARESVESTYQDAIGLVKEQENEAQLQYRYGLLDYETYQTMQKEFSNVRRLLASDRDDQISEIEYNYAAITGAMKNQVDAQIKEQAEFLAAQEHWVRLGLEEMPKTMSDSIRDAIDAFKRTQHKEWDGSIKDGEKLWQDWYSSQVNTAKYNMHHLDEKIDSYAAQIDILPNPNAGRKWMQSMADNSKAELPSVLSEMDYIMGQIRDEIDKEGKTAYMPSADVEKLVKERYFSLGENQRNEYLKGFDVNGINQTIFNNLGGAGSEAGSSFVNGVSNSGIVNSISGMLNGVGNSGYNAGYNWGSNFAEGAKRQILGQEIEVNWFDSKKNSMYSGSILFQADGFSGGGIVNADLFYANENGKAEFISSIGNRPAVANQQQMRSEIRQGVKEGMAEALRTTTGANGDVYVFIDSEQIAYRMERRNAQKVKMTGGR